MTRNKLRDATCKLCLLESDLQDSHFLPKAAYRLIQKSQAEAPIVIRPTVTLQTNKQLKDYVFCRECEQRFNDKGERWVMKHCFRGPGDFKLLDFVRASTPVLNFRQGLTLYSARTIPQIDIA